MKHRCLCSFDQTLVRHAPRGEYCQRSRAYPRLVMAEKSGRQHLRIPHGQIWSVLTRIRHPQNIQGWAAGTRTQALQVARPHLYQMRYEIINLSRSSLQSSDSAWKANCRLSPPALPLLLLVLTLQLYWPFDYLYHSEKLLCSNSNRS